jgi:hypothetical protein
VRLVRKKLELLRRYKVLCQVSFDKYISAQKPHILLTQSWLTEYKVKSLSQLEMKGSRSALTELIGSVLGRGPDPDI